MTTPFETSTAVLDAAAAGTTVPGYEQIGGLLIDLARTTAVPPGAALGSGGVAAACATMAPGRLAAAAGLVKPGLIVVSLVSLAVVVGAVLSSSSKPAVVVTPGAPDAGISRVVPVTRPSPTDRSRAGSESGDPLGAEKSTAPDSSRPGGPQGSGDMMTPAEPTPSSAAVPSATAAPTTSPSTAVPSATVPSATVAPTTLPSSTVPSTTVAPTTLPSTTVPSTTTAEPLGNNGNGNGNGAGNGKGNQGNGTPGGDGGKGPTSG